MPLVGTRDVASLAGDAPLVKDLASGPAELPGARILQVMYEIDERAITSLLPPALHPTIPPVVFFTITHAPESPWGPFTLGEARAGCRSGARPRSLSLRAYCDSPAAIETLRTRWGYPLFEAKVSLSKNYDRIGGSVQSDEGLILECGIRNPEPVSGNDVQYMATLNVARILRDGSELTRLIQVDPDYVFRGADRGQPQLTAFRAGAFGLEGAEPNHAVSASYTVADISLPQLRYLVDPEKPPLQSVERL
ncbi:MAG: acetoacetate decarboxylase family protein [Tepidiformaceae bacterium]